jgi:hypothetical protein
MMRIHGIHGDGHLTIGCGTLPIGFWRDGAAVHRDMARLGAATYELDEVPPRSGRVLGVYCTKSYPLGKCNPLLCC